MRPAGKGPLDSLYFHYPHFPARHVPELDGSAVRYPVVIVGAGPIGMTASLVLARYGIRSVLLDRKDTFNDGSRALCIARPSMHILERIGAVAPFLDKALGWRFGRSYYRGEQIFRLEMPHPPGEKYLPMYNLQQQYIEQYLHDAVAACDLVDMRWQSELTGIECGNDGVSLNIASPAGDYRLDADYVLAADGARSPVRTQLGLRMKGDNYEGKYVIADIRMDHDFPTERRAFFEPSGNPGGTVLIHKQPENIWRVDYQLREGESEEAALLEENIRARVGAILGDIGHTNRGSWNGGASIPPTRCASTTTGMAGCSSSAMPPISCRFLACAVSTTAWPTPTISAGSSRRCSTAKPTKSCSTAIRRSGAAPRWTCSPMPPRAPAS